MSKKTDAKLDALATSLEVLRKIYTAAEIDDFGNVVIPERNYTGIYSELLSQIDKAERIIASGVDGNYTDKERLLVLATKHCPRDHHDWQEILRIYGAR